MARTKQIPKSSAPNRHYKVMLKEMKLKMINDEEKVDRLGNLPESLVSNILSRLPTKEAVQTSLLSKDWEYKWSSIYDLDLNDRNYTTCSRSTRKEKFANFVDRVLVHKGGEYSLRSVKIKCSSQYELTRIRSWISTALRRNVEKLEIDIWSASIVLPRNLYTCKSLKELRIFSQVTLRVPNETFFSKLKTIDFNHVILRNQESTNGELELNFPCLESMIMYCCKWKKVTHVKMNAPIMTSFHATYANYQFRDKTEGQFVFEIFGPKLVDFQLNGELSENYVLLPNKPSPIQNATLKVFFSNEWLPRGNRTGTLLRQLNAVTFLELSGEALIALTHGGEVGNQLPVFVNLTHLKLYSTYYYYTDGAAVIRLLHRTPVLRMLTMNLHTLVGRDLLYDGSLNEAVPKCFNSDLKEVKFRFAIDYLRREQDLGLMMYILKNAKELQHMEIICPEFKTIPLPSPEIRNKLFSAPRASKVAIITII